MINTAAKIQLLLAAAALVLAIGLLSTVGDPGGFVIILGVSFAVAFSGLALTGSGFKDRAPVFLSPADAPPVQMVSMGRSRSVRPSPWPLVGALAVGLVAVGLAVGSSVVEVGVVVGLAAAAGWLAQAWREDPTYTPSEAARVSGRLLAPVGFPLMALGLIAVIVISVSRVLLTLPRVGSIVTAFVGALGLLLAFFALSSRPHLARKSLVLLAGVAIAGVVTAGSVSAANGYRTFDKLGTGPETVNVIAHNTAFQLKTITVTQGKLTAITFHNIDPIYHNVAVYTDSGGPVWDGEPIKGNKKITYEHVFNLPPGTYTFRCDFHPTSMIGTFIVKAASTTSTTQGAP
jgi:plastocyanin